MSEIEKKSNSKWSRVELEVEKMKVQCDIEATGRDFKTMRGIAWLEDPLSDAQCVFEYTSEENLRNQIDAKWIRVCGDCFDFCATVGELSSDEEKIELFNRYTDEVSDIKDDPELIAAFATTIESDDLKHNYIQQLNKLWESNTRNVKEFVEAAEYAGITEYTEDVSRKVLRDRTIAWVAANLSDVESIIQYYGGMEDIYAKKILLDAISRFEFYSRDLSIEELQEVSEIMKNEVRQAEALNAQTRKALEEEILEEVSRLVQAKREYARLTAKNLESRLS